MATVERSERARATTPFNVGGRTFDETKLSLKTTEFWAMVGIIVAVLIASAVSDSLDDVRAWTLVAAVGIGIGDGQDGLTARQLPGIGATDLANANQLLATFIPFRVESASEFERKYKSFLLLVGDEQLLPRLQMGINAPLLARLSFCLHLPAWTSADLNAYLEVRLQQAGIHANPFESSAQQLLIQLANGLPRRLNQVAQRAMQQALEQNSRAVTAAHIHSALELLPWVAKL